MSKNNEPVAWMEYIQDEEWEVWFVEPTDLPKGHTYKPLSTHPANEAIYFSKAEIESGLSRVKWAELLIKQLPEEHEGRNSWLLNYGEKK